MSVAPSGRVWSGPRYLLAGLLAAAAVASPQSAQAVGRLITPTQSSARVEQLRVAVAAGPARTTLWVSLQLGGDGSRGLVVIPVEPGSLVDLVNDAWFEALEDATAPRVLPPPGEDAADCGSSGDTVDNTTRLPTRPTLSASETVVLSSLSDLTAYARSSELGLTSDDSAALSGAGAAYLALAYELPVGEVFTQALRISLPGSRSMVGLALAREPEASPVRATLYSIGQGRAQLVGLTELTPSSVDATWIASSGRSDYLDRAQALLDQRRGRASLLESAGTDLLYAWSILPSDAAVMPFVRRYLTGVFEPSDHEPPTGACLADVWQARASAAVVSPACAPGSLARIPLADGADPGFAEEPAAGELDPEILRCEGADELALAFSGLQLQEAVLTRHRLLLTDETPAELQLEWFDGPPQTVAVHAGGIDLTGCVVEPTSAEQSGATLVGSSRTDARREPGSEQRWSAQAYPADEVPPEPADSSVEASFACWGSPEPDPQPSPYPPASDDEETCSGDSSDDTDEETCSGDSSDYSDDEETCSGDSSDDTDEETCGGDSSESADDQETCTSDGPDNSSYDDGTCSADSEASVRADCTASRRRFRKPRLSLLTVLLSAFLLPLRRRLRSRRRQPRD